MRCPYCDGDDTIEEQLTRFCACDAPEPFIVDNLPARVCRLCGDKSFSDKAISALEAIRDGQAGPSSIQSIRIFDFNHPNSGPATDPPRYILATRYPEASMSLPDFICRSSQYGMVRLLEVAGAAGFQRLPSVDTRLLADFSYARPDMSQWWKTMVVAQTTGNSIRLSDT